MSSVIMAKKDMKKKQKNDNLSDNAKMYDDAS